MESTAMILRRKIRFRIPHPRRFQPSGYQIHSACPPRRSCGTPHPESSGPSSLPQVKAAADQIVNQFYNNISKNASERISTGEQAMMEDSGEGATVVVQPDRETSDILRNSNEMFRALYGNAAFNSNLLRSSIEARLPVPPAGGSNSGH